MSAASLNHGRYALGSKSFGSIGADVYAKEDYAAQQYADCQPPAPLLARIAQLVDEIVNISTGNLVSVNGVADRLAGSIPQADCASNGQLIGNGFLDNLEDSLKGVLAIAGNTSAAISRIERLF